MMDPKYFAAGRLGSAVDLAWSHPVALIDLGPRKRPHVFCNFKSPHYIYIPGTASSSLLLIGPCLRNVILIVCGNTPLC